METEKNDRRGNRHAGESFPGYVPRVTVPGMGTHDGERRFALPFPQPVPHVPSKVPGTDHRRIAYSPSLFNSLLELRYSVKFLTSVATHFRKKFRAASLSASTRSFMPT